MGSGSSVLSKKPKEPSSDCSILNDEKQPDKFDSNDLIVIYDDTYLMELPKQALISKIREMQTRFVPDANNSNKCSSNVGLIPRAMFSEYDSSSRETVRSKDALIFQLESELRAQNRIFENQKSQSKEKLAKYSAEISDLRFRNSKRIQELEMELNKQINSSQQNPLIMKLSQKLNDQAQIIKELESSLARKDEIIDGFKIFESSQYNRRFDTCEENQHNNNKHYDPVFEKSEKESRSFNSQDLMIVDSYNRAVELSLSDEPMSCEDQFKPMKYVISKTNAATGESNNAKVFSNKVSCVISNKKLVKLPTDIIEPSSSSKI